MLEKCKELKIETDSESEHICVERNSGFMRT